MSCTLYEKNFLYAHANEVVQTPSTYRNNAQFQIPGIFPQQNTSPFFVWPPTQNLLDTRHILTPEMDQKLQKHFVEFENYLKKAKKDFETKWKAEFATRGSLSEFQIMKTLGTGSFGRVVLAQHRKKEGKLLAIKMMEKKHVVKTKQVQHTIAEIRVMDAVNFPYMITMEFFFVDNVYLFLVMPFINGGEMFAHLRNMRKFDENLSRFYTAQVVLAFEYIHYLGLVYRDLKPENILMDCQGFLKITDYGFCKKIDDQRTYTLCGKSIILMEENSTRVVFGFRHAGIFSTGNNHEPRIQ